MKTKILIANIFIVLMLLAVSCVEDDMYKGSANIEKVEYAPLAVTPDDDVTVTATITDLQGVTAAKIQYKVNGGSQTEVVMVKGSGDTFTGVIPKQDDKAVVVFTVLADNEAGITAVSNELEYTVGAAPIDYNKLVLNEIDGNSKAIELFNTGTVDLSLNGVSLVKNNGSSAWWTGSAESGKIPAGGYVLIIQSNPDNPHLSGASGISPKQNLKFELFAPDGTSLGAFLRGDENNLSGSISDTAPNSFQRIPNGTGDWKIAAPTNGAANASTGSDIPQQ